jgi:hypothetical protein
VAGPRAGLHRHDPCRIEAEAISIDPPDEFSGKFPEEPRRVVFDEHASERTRAAANEIECLHCPRDPDVAEASFLVDIAFLKGAGVWKDALLHADDEDRGELESLGGVKGHQGHDIITWTGPDCVCIRHKGCILQEETKALVGTRCPVLRDHGLEFLNILPPLLAVVVTVFQEVLPETGPLEEQVEEVGK